MAWMVQMASLFSRSTITCLLWRVTGMEKYLSQGSCFSLCSHWMVATTGWASQLQVVGTQVYGEPAVLPGGARELDVLAEQGFAGSAVFRGRTG